MHKIVVAASFMAPVGGFTLHGRVVAGWLGLRVGRLRSGKVGRVYLRAIVEILKVVMHILLLMFPESDERRVLVV